MTAPGHPFATFQEALDFLEKAIDYEKRTAVKYTDKNFNLSRMNALLAELGDPHRAYAVVHIGGTKGKGTTAALIARCLQKQGYRTGIHTSPHLVSVCERMCVDGQPISEEEFCRLLGTVRDYIERKRRQVRDDAPTYFETTTALAFKHFRERAADWGIVEVGLGGRLDSTNVVQPACCVITPIGLDHMDKLGDTVDKIAGEKAGIFKPGVPVVLARQAYGEALRVLRERAELTGCPRWEVDREIVITHSAPLTAPPGEPDAPLGWRFSLCTPLRSYENLFTPLLGAHQVENCAAAIGTLDMLSARGSLKISPEAVREGIAVCRWPARVELLRRRPAFVLDVAHTVESVRALLEALWTHLPGRTLHAAFGCSADKNWRDMLGLLAPRCADLVITRAASHRAADPAELAQAARQAGAALVEAVPDAAEAARACLRRAGPDDIACVSGSFFVAGEVLRAWQRGEIA